ncbi:MAG: branched-chain amino acid ABC transporter permease [Thermoleophilia bacterium]|nr:branched-chain amino acid ABC transporter permease [Thermoleophilia bacterium]
MEWVNAVVQGILLGGLYALFATGLSLVFGVMRLVNLAHGDLSILAAFLLVAIVDATGLDPWIGLALVVPALFVIGYVLQYGLLNRTLAGGELAPLLVTFGLSIILQNVLLEVFTADSRGLDAGSIETSSIRISDQISIGWFPLVTFIVSIVLLSVLQLALSRTRTGRALRATADDPRTAQLQGIDNRRIYALAMGIALATVALAGVFLGMRTTFGPAIGPARLIFAFEAVIIGGLGSLWGTLVGGIVLGVAQTVGAQISPGWGVLTGHLVFLAVLATRPTGLFSRQVRQ